MKLDCVDGSDEDFEYVLSKKLEPEDLKCGNWLNIRKAVLKTHSKTDIIRRRVFESVFKILPYFSCICLQKYSLRIDNQSYFS